MSTVHLPFFGIHEDTETGVKWLVQDRAHDNVVGLAKKSFKPVVDKALKCPHHIVLPKKINFESSKKELETYDIIINHPITKHIAPIPDNSAAKFVYVIAKSLEESMALSYLMMMNSPVVPMNTPIALVGLSTQHIFAKLNASNIARYLITGVESDMTSELTGWVRMTFGCQGKLIMSGEKFHSYELNRVTEIVEMDKELTDLVLSNKNSELYKSIGAALVYNYLRP
jgi:hypothetical protein